MPSRPPPCSRRRTSPGNRVQTDLDFDTTVGVGEAADGRAAVLSPGITVAGYVVETMSARGGFATVYRARAAATGEIVALKLLHPELSTSSTLVRRFRQEAEALNLIAHRNIVKIFEVGEFTPGRPFLAMEWIHGHTLEAELRRRGTFSADEVLGIMEDLCAGLAAAHDAGVVHRDLKASNVMIVPRGHWFDLKIVDLGIAKLVDNEASGAKQGLTTTGTVIGTPHCMAPEQVLGQQVDQRTDIYALGVLTYFLLTGRYPFQARTA